DDVPITPMPLTPIYYASVSTTVGRERGVKLPLRGAAADGAGDVTAEVRRLSGSRMTLRGSVDGAYVTLDLDARTAGFDVAPPYGVVEIEGRYRDTFAVEASGSFIAAAPLGRYALAGIRDVKGPDG